MTSAYVSVLMSVHNGQRYLSEALDSILDQTLSDFEFVIVDDGSEDDSWEMLVTYAARDDRVELLRNSDNQGLARSLNRGIDLCSGEFIARMDADDVAHPRRLERQVAAFKQNPYLGLLGTEGWSTDPARSTRRRFTRPHTDTEIRWVNLLRNPFRHPTIMFRRELFETNSLRYNDSLSTSQDWDLWQRALQITEAANLPEPLLDWRRHPGSIGATRHKGQVENSGTVIQRAVSVTLPSQNLTHEDALGLSKLMFGGHGMDKEGLRRALVTALSLFERYWSDIQAPQTEEYWRRELSKRLARTAVRTGGAPATVAPLLRFDPGCFLALARTKTRELVT